MDPATDSARRWALARTRGAIHRFALGSVVLGGVTAAGSVLITVPAHPTSGDRLLVALAVFALAVVATFLAGFLWFLFRAPYEQRDKLRADMKRLTGTGEEFVAWVLSRRAALPIRQGVRIVPSIFEDSPSRAAYDAEQHDIAKIHAEARLQYHERFRVGVVQLLGREHTLACDPQTIEDLEALAKLVREASSP